MPTVHYVAFPPCLKKKFEIFLLVMVRTRHMPDATGERGKLRNAIKFFGPTFSSSFSIAVALITNGPLTAYSIFLMAGFMFSRVTEGMVADSIASEVVERPLMRMPPHDSRRQLEEASSRLLLRPRAMALRVPHAPPAACAGADAAAAATACRDKPARPPDCSILALRSLRLGRPEPEITISKLCWEENEEAVRGRDNDRLHAVCLIS